MADSSILPSLAALADLFPPDELLAGLLDVSLTGVILFAPCTSFERRICCRWRSVYGINSDNALVFEHASRKTTCLVHELLHALGLYHTFDNDSLFTFPKVTENVMDYTNPRYTTFKWQWDIIRKHTLVKPEQMYKLIIILIFFSSTSCNVQESKVNEPKKENEPKKKEVTMERFDIDEFNKYQQNNEWTYTDGEGNVVRAIKDESIVFENNQYTTKTKMEGYSVEVRSKKSLFNIDKNFHPNGLLKLTGISFHDGFPKGVWKEYNENGELIKEIDYDIPYKSYPWEKVEEFLLSRKVDLMSSFTNVNRELNDQNTPTWYLSWDTGKKDAAMFQIIENVEIDARTGKIIKEYHTFREP